MPRELKDDQGLTWSCEQAFAGLSDGAAKEAAARAVAGGDGVVVVCTPSGGAASVRLTLDEDWEHALSDDALRAAITRALDEKQAGGDAPGSGT